MINGIDIEDIIITLENDLSVVNSQYTLKHKVAGDNIMITCPYHSHGQERHPSMGIALNDTPTTEKGTAHCFTCGKVVSLPALISFILGYDDLGKYGNKWLSKNFYSYSEERPTINILKPVVEKPPFVDISSPEYTYNHHPYILNRGISPEIIELFQIGFDPQTNSIMFPVMDKKGNCLFIQRRSIDSKIFINDTNANKSQTLYGLNMIYNKLDDLSSNTHLYVVESIIDALYLWSNGYIAVALMQAQASKNQVQLLKELPIYNMILAQDNDSAGEHGAQKLRSQLKDKHLARIVFPFGCKDINDMTVEQLRQQQISYIY